MAFHSLVWLLDSQTSPVNDNVIRDLNLEKIFEQLIDRSPMSQSIINKLCMDQQTLNYRQDIMEDLMQYPQLIEDMIQILVGFETIQHRYKRVEKPEYQLYESIHLMVTVEMAIHTIIALYDVLKSYPLKAKGLLDLQEDLEGKIQAEVFLEMKKDLNEIRYILAQVKSVELSINMTTGMRPTDAQVTGVNDVKYRFPKAFKNVTRVLENDAVFMDRKFKVFQSIFTVAQMDWDLLEEVEYSLRKYKKTLQVFNAKYEKIDLQPFLSLLCEVTFYEASCQMFGQIKAKGFPLCRPIVSPMHNREMEVKEIYNLKLMSNKPEETIYNDLAMNDQGRIYIVTGANRGGKTTFTQAIGQIQLFAQLGLWVPAAYAKVSLVDGIWTHFPVQEKETVDLGKFGKECQQFSEIFQKTTSHSLLLLNESFAGTSHLESIKIADEVVHAVHSKRCRMVFNTHLHELPTQVIRYNTEESNDAYIVSLITGGVDSMTFKVRKGEPFGQSYARNIAKRYGVTLEQLVQSKEVDHV